MVAFILFCLRPADVAEQLTEICKLPRLVPDQIPARVIPGVSRKRRRLAVRVKASVRGTELLLCAALVIFDVVYQSHR